MATKKKNSNKFLLAAAALGALWIYGKSKAEVKPSPRPPQPDTNPPTTNSTQTGNNANNAAAAAVSGVYL